jgi:tetratricopeptide (TPR) repeat protein
MRRRPDSRLQASQVAHHYHQAGQESKAAEYYYLAGEYARDVLAYQEAITNFQAALAAGHPETARLHEAIGDLMTRQGDYREAMLEYETSAALSGSSPQLEQKIGNLHHRRGEWELAACHYQLALDMLALQDDPERKARILADWSLTAHNQGQSDSALQYASQSLELAAANQLLPALASAHNILGILARQAGEPQEALSHLLDSLALARQANDLDGQAAALNNLALVYRDILDLPQAILHAREALAICQSRGDRHREAALLNHLADLYHLTGDQDNSMTYLKQAVTIFSEIGITEGNILPEIWKLTEW